MLEKIKTKISEISFGQYIIILVIVLVLALSALSLNLSLQLDGKVKENKELMGVVSNKTDIEKIQDKVEGYKSIKGMYEDSIEKIKSELNDTEAKLNITERLLECNINQATRLLKGETVISDYCETQGLN